MSKVPMVSDVLEGELSYCICQSTEREGHTFACIMAQHERHVKKFPFAIPRNWGLAMEMNGELPPQEKDQ